MTTEVFKSDTTVTIRLPSDMKAKLIQRAEKNRRTLSDYLKMSLELWLEWEEHILAAEEDSKIRNHER